MDQKNWQAVKPGLIVFATTFLAFGIGSFLANLTLIPIAFATVLWAFFFHGREQFLEQMTVLTQGSLVLSVVLVCVASATLGVLTSAVVRGLQLRRQNPLTISS